MAQYRKIILATVVFTLIAFTSVQAEPPLKPGNPGLPGCLAEVAELQTEIDELKSKALVQQTGQTDCYGEGGDLLPDCTDTGQDGEYRMGVMCPEPRFTDNLDGTVTDKCTGLVWLKDANCFGARTWSEALSDSNTLGDGQCDLTDGSSPSDWRLPNTRELFSLIDFSQSYPALPAGHPFIKLVIGYYWSSTTYVPDMNTNQAWRTCTHCGHQQPDNKTDHHYVWPVRGGN